MSPKFWTAIKDAIILMPGIKRGEFSIIIFLFLLFAGLFFYPIIGTRLFIGNFGDLFAYYYPLKYHALSNLQIGHIPLWNPYIFCGTPFLANLQSSVFYPMGIIFYLMPLKNAFVFFYIFHYLFSFIGMYLLCRQWGKPSWISLSSAIVFSFSAFFILKLAHGHPVHMAGYSCIPFVLLFIRNYMRHNKSIVNGIIISIILALQFLSGHIQPLYITVIVVFIYILFNWRLCSQHIVLVWLVFVLLIAVQLLPTIEYGRLSLRTLWNYELATSYSLTLKNYISMLFPFWFGDPLASNFMDPDHPSVFFEQFCLYIGIIPLICIGIGIVYAVRRRQILLLVLSIVGFLLSLGNNTSLYRFFYSYVPGFDILRAPARFYVIVLFVCALLSAVGLESIKQIIKNYYLRLLIIGVIFISLFIPLKKYVYVQDQHQYLGESPVISFCRNIFQYHITTDETINNPNKSMLYRQFNIAGYEALFLRNYVEYINASQDEPAVSTVRVHIKNYISPLIKTLGNRYFITGNERKDADPIYHNPLAFIYETADVSKRCYFAHREINVKDNDQVLPFMKSSEFNPGKDVVINNSVVSFKTLSQNNEIIKIVHRPDKIIIKSKINKESWLVVNDAYMPGWEAYCNTKKIIKRCNYLVKGIWIDDVGVQKIYLLYRPMSYRIGLVVSIFTVVFLIVYLQLNIINKEM